MKNKSFTLIEVLVAMFILVIAIGSLAMIYPGILSGVRVNSQALSAWEVAKLQIENLKSSTFSTLYGVSYAPGAPPVINTFTTGVANTSGVYYVERMLNSSGTTLTDLVKIEVVVCSKSGNRVIGEDANLNGALDFGEDINHDGKITSPITLTTLVMQQ